MEPISPELVLVDPELRAAAIARLAAAPWEAPVPAPRVPAVVATPPAPAPAVPALAAPAPEPRPPLRLRRVRRRARLLLLPAAAGLVAALALVNSGGRDQPHLLPRDRTSAPTTGAPRPSGAPEAATTVGAPASGAAPERPLPSGAPEMSAPTGAQPTPTPPPATTAPVPQPAAPPASGSGTEAGGFVPARTFAWPPDPRASYYDVRFFRDGKRFYRAQPREARLELPEELSFPRGSYRWIVVPGYGPPDERRLGAPLVDSTFEVR